MSTDARRRVVIFGTGSAGQVLHACLQFDPSRIVVAFTAERRFVHEPQMDGLPVYPFDEIDTHCPPSRHAMLLAVGPIDRNRLRARIFDEALARGYDVDSYIDPSVRRYPSNHVGRGCLIADGVSLQPDARIEDNVVVRPLAYVGHHVRIEAHCFIAPHAALLGYCRIGPFSFIAAHATISNHVTVGPHSVVSGGAVVTRDIPANSIVRGRQ